MTNADWSERQNKKKEDREPASIVVMRLYPQCKEKATLIAIASFGDPDGSNMFPSIAGIAKRSGRSIRTTQDHIEEMRNRNHLTVQYQVKRKGRAMLNIFTIIHPEIKEVFTRVSKNQIKLPLPQKTELSQMHIPMPPPRSPETTALFEEEMKKIELSINSQHDSEGHLIMPAEYNEIEGAEVRAIIEEEFGVSAG